MNRPIPVLKGLAASLLATLATLTPAAADEAIRVGLLPIEVHSSGRSDYLRDGLGDMLFTRIDGRDGVTAVRIAAEGSAGDKLVQAISAGRSAGTDYVVFGSFTRFGDGASLDLFCAPVADNGDERDLPRKLFVQSGDLAEIIPALDGLVEKMAGFLGGAGNGAPAVSAAAGGPPNGAADYEALVRRVEALERALAENGQPPELAESAEPAESPGLGVEDLEEILGGSEAP